MLARVNSINLPYTIVLAVIYLIAAFTIIAAPNNTIGLMIEFGLHKGTYAIMLAAAAAILLTRPSTIWFVVSLLPIAIYAVVSVLYATRLTMPNTGLILIFAIMQVAYPLAYRLCRADGIRIHHVYGLTLLPLSVSVFTSPALGVVGWIQTTYGIYAIVIGLTIGIGSIIMLIMGTKRSFIGILLLLMLYTAAGFVSSLPRNAMGAIVQLTMFITAVYTMIKLGKYFKAEGSINEY